MRKKLTDLEFKMLHAILTSDFASDMGGPTNPKQINHEMWAFVVEYAKMGTSAGGVVASLVKKGFLEEFTYGKRRDENTIRVTAAGHAAYCASPHNVK